MNNYPSTPDGERMLRINEVADMLRVSDKTIRRMIDSRRLVACKIRGILLIKWSDVQKLLV